MAVALLLPAYFSNYHRPPYHPLPKSVGSFFSYLAGVISLSFGAAGEVYWPLPTELVIALCLWVGVKAVHEFIRDPSVRLPLGPILIALVATFSAAAAIAWGRSEVGQGRFPLRYIVLMVPIPCAMFLYGALFHRKFAGRFVQVSLLLLFVLFAPENYRSGHKEARDYFLSRMRPAYQALGLGLGGDAKDFAERFAGDLLIDKHYMTASCEALQRAQVGRFRRLYAPPVPSAASGPAAAK